VGCLPEVAIRLPPLGPLFRRVAEIDADDGQEFGLGVQLSGHPQPLRRSVEPSLKIPELGTSPRSQAVTPGCSVFGAFRLENH